MTPVGEDAYHVVAVVENAGFFPTHVSQQALKRKAVRPVRMELSLNEGVALVSGKLKTEIGQLEGRSNKLDVDNLWGSSPTDNRGKAEWVVRAPAGTKVTVTGIAERAGTIRQEVTLG